MRAELGLPSVRGDDEKGGGMMGGFGGSMGGVGGGKAKRPINVKFEIPYFTTSGIQVRYLKIIEPKVRTNCNMIKEAVANMRAVAIPIATLGTIHYTVRRHRCAVTRRELGSAKRALAMNIPIRLWNMLFMCTALLKSSYEKDRVVCDYE